MDKAENIVNEQRLGEHLDYRDKAWFWDKCFEILMFVAGVSAIVLIISIFFFITKGKIFIKSFEKPFKE